MEMAFLGLEVDVLDLEQLMLSACSRFAGSYAKVNTPIMNQGSFLLLTAP